MLWFRIASVANIACVLVWSIGIAAGIIQMCQVGGENKDMIEDPDKNGTLAVYVGLCITEIITAILSLFGLFVGFQMWRNNYQIDHSTRQLFIMWLAGSALTALLCLVNGIYMLIRSRDSQENMARLYDSFTRYAQDTIFVSSFEKYQRENQCCGIYTPDDWLMLQLRQMPAAGGGGGGYQSLDYGFRQNPSTGKCHMQPPTIPPGCGIKMMEDINFRLKMYAALALVEVLIIISACGFASYCFFYWLEKEVIVIPEDEVSNVVIIEPESGSTVILSPPSLSASQYLTASGYLRSTLPSGRYGLMGSRLGGSRYLQPSVIHLTHTEVLRDQERALEHEFGGHVLAEMHVDHKSTKMIPPQGSAAHHATVALVRNKHPPEKKDIFHTKGHHGQTGNLAQDIADMSGGSAKDYIEDVVIPPGTSEIIEIPIDHEFPDSKRSSQLPSFSNTAVDGGAAQNLIEGLIEPPKPKSLTKAGASKHGHHGHHSNHHGHHSNHHGHHHGSQLYGSQVHHSHHRSGYLDAGHHHHGGSYLAHGGHHHGSHHHGSHAGSHHHHHHGSVIGSHHHHHGSGINSHHHHPHHHHGSLIGSHHHHHGSNHNGSNHHHHHGLHENHHHHGGHHGHHNHHHLGSNSHHHNHGHHGHHGHHHHHHGRDLSRATTVLFRNPRPMEND